MGKSAGKQAQTALTNAATASAGISKDLQTSLIPDAKTASNYYSAVASGDQAKLSQYVGPQVNAAKDAYSTARTQIENSAPKGGQRDQALTDLSTRQAGDVSRIMTGGTQDALAHLESLGQLGVNGALSGLNTSTGAGTSLAQLSAAQAEAWGKAIAGIGGAAGMAIGGQSAKPTAPVPVQTGGAVGVHF